jgi:outer membrane protein
MHHNKSLSMAALLLASAASTHAQQAQGPEATQWGIGAGVAVERKPYRDYDDKTHGIPLLMFENRWVSILGTQFDLKLHGTESLSFSLRARYDFDGYEADDSPYLQGMADRKSSVWLGGAAKLKTGFANLSAEALGDAANKSKGTRLKLGIERDFNIGDLQLTPRIAARWVDKKYVDYYYGVRAAEATPARGAYTGRSTTNVELGLRATHALTPRQALLIDLNATRLGSSIKDSPLVERSNQTGMSVGYLYRF